MIRTVLINTGSSPNIEYSWIWDKYSLFTDGPYSPGGHRGDVHYADEIQNWVRGIRVLPPLYLIEINMAC